MKKIGEIYNNLEAHLLVVSLIFTVILIFFQVILRYVFNSSLSWAEELARYVFIWQIWLGTSVAQRGHAHVRIELFQGKPLQRMITIIADVIWLLFCLILVKYGADLAISIKNRNLLSAAMKIPMYLVYASLAVSQLAVSIRIIGEIAGQVRLMVQGREGGTSV